jgi:bifunctional non-homologous end joining protein LigD
MSLSTYWKKRDFSKTREPKGRVVKADDGRRGDGRRFVVHEHHASVLHFDFRLEIDGVLKSWSLPRGPSLDADQRRLAVQVEDHPVSYARFSGVIPEGQYGAGRSLIWDEGTFTVPRGQDPSEGWKAGKLTFTLRGKKLRGAFTLVRMKGRKQGDKPQWLLLKNDDRYAKPGWRLELEEDDPRFKPDGAKRKSPRAASERKVTRDRPAKAISVATFLERVDELEGDVGLRIGRTAVEVTSLDRVYWPREGYTKADLIAYYLRVGKLIMPHLKGRPAILKRFPNGIKDDGFFQHDVTSAPALLKTEKLESETGRVLNYAVYTDLASLVYLVNIGTIAQNPWLSPLAHLDRPDHVVIDLDPKGAPFENVLAVARNARTVLDELGLTAFVKTSGSTGIHIFVPIKPVYDYDRVAGFAERVATRIAAVDPKISTVARSLAERQKSQVYVDWQQNARGKSAASVYSVRAKPGATVSAPVTWDEVERGLAIADFTIETMPGRIDDVGDLWADLFKRRQSLPED